MIRRASVPRQRRRRVLPDAIIAHLLSAHVVNNIYVYVCRRAAAADVAREININTRPSVTEY